MLVVILWLQLLKPGVIGLKNFKRLFYFFILPKNTNSLPTLFFYFMKIEYNKSYTHFIFTTLHRLPLISEDYRQQIEKYITGIVNHLGCELYAIYANPEHVHFLVSLASNLSEADFAESIANDSDHYINEKKLSDGIFKWENTCSAFSVSKRDVNKVNDFILGQKEHHQIQTFDQEYEEFLKVYQVK